MNALVRRVLDEVSEHNTFKTLKTKESSPGRKDCVVILSLKQAVGDFIVFKLLKVY